MRRFEVEQHYEGLYVPTEVSLGLRFWWGGRGRMEGESEGGEGWGKGRWMEEGKGVVYYNCKVFSRMMLLWFSVCHIIIYSLNLHVFAGAEENFDKNWVNRYLCLIESSKSTLHSIVVEKVMHGSNKELVLRLFLKLHITLEYSYRDSMVQENWVHSLTWVRTTGDQHQIPVSSTDSCLLRDIVRSPGIKSSTCMVASTLHW